MLIVRFIGKNYAKTLFYSQNQNGGAAFLPALKDRVSTLSFGMIPVRDYRPEDAQELASIYFNTVHRVNIKDYTQEQVDAWAPPSKFKSNGGAEDWAKRFARTKPIIATIGDKVIGFAEFEPNGHIDCFYCHHEWIGKGVGSCLMKEILVRAKKSHIHRIFAEVSITAKPFFEKYDFVVVTEQVVHKKGIGLINYKMERLI